MFNTVTIILTSGLLHTFTMWHTNDLSVPSNFYMQLFIGEKNNPRKQSMI